MGQLTLLNPLLVARSGNIAIIVGSDDRANPLADAQLWSPANGYSDVRVLAVHLKFMFYVTWLATPTPWQEEKQ